MPGTQLLQQSALFGQSVTVTRPLPIPAGLTRSKLTDPFSLPDDPYGMRPTGPIEREPRVVGEELARSTDDPLLRSQGVVSPTALAPKLFTAADRQPEPTGSSVGVLPSTTLMGPSPVEVEPTAGFAQLPGLPEDVAARDVVAGAASPVIPSHSSWLAEDPLAFEPRGVDPWLDLANAVEFLAYLDEMSEAQSAQRPGLTRLQERRQQALAIVRSASEGSVDSLAGMNRSRVNDLISQAEDHMRNGRYYKAAASYRLAETLDPRNPIIRLGHGNALLAAGEYLTAVFHLSIALENYPAMAYLPLDLKSFVTDLGVLDLRRADLEQRLLRREDFRLRFLLGYTEYYSGLAKFGLPNLEKAARSAPEGSAIAEFPEMLQRDLWAPQQSTGE
jgi:hypothetical protein